MQNGNLFAVLGETGKVGGAAIRELSRLYAYPVVSANHKL